MAHNITAIVIADAFRAEVAKTLDLVAVPLTATITLFHIDHAYTAYWQAVRGCTKELDLPPDASGILPRHGILVQLVSELTGLPAPKFALIQTEYFGGAGEQYACAFTGEERKSRDDATINDALRFLGVVREGGQDEFATVGLGDHRSSPNYLLRYVDLCAKLGVI